MFGTLGGPEVILILVVALIVFGPRRLPEIGKSMGRMLAEFRKASNDFKRTIDDELEAEKARESQAAAVPPSETVPAPAMVHMITPPEAEPATAPTADAPAAAPTPEAEPRLEAPPEPVVSRDHSADEK